MATRDQRHANVSKQTTFLDGINVGPPKWRLCGRGLNRSVHEGINDISNVKGSDCRNVNINLYLHFHCIHLR